MTSVYQQRLSKLRHALRQKNLDAMLVTDLVNIRYLTGFSGTTAVLFVGPDDARIYLDFRYFEQARHDVASCCRVVEWSAKEKDLYDDLCGHIKGLRIGFESETLACQRYQRFCHGLSRKLLYPASALLKKMRAVKDPSEVALIQKSIRIAEKAFMGLCAILRPGMSEWDISTELEYLLRKGGAQKKAFDFIVLAGRRSSLPHGQPGKKKIRNNSLILIDFGAVYKGYNSDLTRVVALGRMPQKFKRIFSVVATAKKRAIEALSSGCSAIEIDRVARTVIAKAGWGECFGHGLGHGLGLEIHEAPSLSPRSKEELCSGMIVTIEPGIYRPGFGGVRLEEDCLVTDEGCRVLSNAQDDIIEA